MQRHEWSSSFPMCYVKWKKPDSKRLYTVWFSSYNILEKPEVQHRETKQISGGQGLGIVGRWLTTKGHEGSLGVAEMLILPPKSYNFAYSFLIFIHVL